MTGARRRCRRRCWSSSSTSRAITADRRAHPTDDLASVIANAEIDGEPIGVLEAVGYYVIIATAGHDTTSASIAGGMHALHRVSQ